MVQVRIPTPLRALTANQAVVTAQGETVRAAIESLESSYPGLRERLLDEQGALRRYIHLFRNDEDLRGAGALDTRLSDGDQLAIVPAIAGGI